MLFSRLAGSVGASTKALAQAGAWDSQSWASLTRSDIGMFWRATPCLSSLPDLQVDVHPWVRWGGIALKSGVR
eukprot:15188377-Alexandrium_andersonii.AAC.1